MHCLPGAGIVSVLEGLLSVEWREQLVIKILGLCYPSFIPYLRSSAKNTCSSFERITTKLFIPSYNGGFSSQFSSKQGYGRAVVSCKYEGKGSDVGEISMCLHLKIVVTERFSKPPFETCSFVPLWVKSGLFSQKTVMLM